MALCFWCGKFHFGIPTSCARGLMNPAVSSVSGEVLGSTTRPIRNFCRTLRAGLFVYFNEEESSSSLECLLESLRFSMAESASPQGFRWRSRRLGSPTWHPSFKGGTLEYLSSNEFALNLIKKASQCSSSWWILRFRCIHNRILSSITVSFAASLSRVGLD